MAETRPLRIPVILGTTRKGRMSAHAARFVHDQLAQRKGVVSELIDITELSLPVDDDREAIKDPGFARSMEEADGVVIVAPEYNLPTLDRSRYAAASGVAKGAYVLADPDEGSPDVILIASGSEVSLALRARDELERDGVRARVVSMPSWELFERQVSSYREKVLPPSIRARVAIEQASASGWARYVGLEGCTIVLETFGASAPLAALQKKFGFTPERIVAAAKDQIRKVSKS